MSGYSPHGGRRRVPVGHDAEEHVLDKISRQGGEVFSKKRQTRDEARQLRMEQLEKQIRANDDSLFPNTDSNATNGLMSFSPRVKKLPDNASVCADSSTADEVNLQEKVNELESKFQRAMLLYSQDEMEEKEQLLYVAKKDVRELNSVKAHFRIIEGMKATQESLRNELAQRDQLIQENGLVVVETETDEGSGVSSIEGSGSTINLRPGPILFSQQTISSIDKAIPGSSTINEKIQKLVDMNKKLRHQVEEAEQAMYARRTRYNDQLNPAHNGVHDEAQRDAAKQVAELKLKLQEAERENTNQQGSIIRLEGQLKRLKQQSDTTDKECIELKSQNRFLKKEARDKGLALDEAKEINRHLQARLEKLRTTRRAS